MKKLIFIFFLILFSTASYAEIVIRVICDSPKGKSISHLIIKPDNEVIFNVFSDDKYLDDDKIELIYDSNNPNHIQFIWDTTNELKKLSGYNENFFHWRLFDKNYANGFYWGDWSFSLPNLILTHAKGHTNDDSLGSGIVSEIFYSKCKRIVMRC